MKKNILFALLCLSNVSYSQNDYYFGYQDGFKNGCGCTDLPTKNVAYYQGTYDSGYKDGTTDGLVYYNNKNKSNQNSSPASKSHNYNNVPLYEPDYTVIQKSLSQKQNLSDQRWSDVMNRISLVSNLINQVKEKKGSLSESEIVFIDTYYNNLENCMSWDLSINANYTNLVNYINNIQASIITWI